nr:ectoine hydroxylase [Nitrosomonas nitrosa]
MRNTEDFYPSRIGPGRGIIERIDPVIYTDIQHQPEDLSGKLKFFEENGYVIFDQLFLPEEVSRYHAELERLLADDALKNRDETIREPASNEIRSIFSVHTLNALFTSLSRDKRILDVVEAIIGSKVYIHQSRLNFKPGFEGKEFYWHSDFETWHVEDGMPRMRAVSCSIALSDNYVFNGSLMVIPGSHRYYVTCEGTTPEEHYKQSLKKQEYGTPDRQTLEWLVERNGIEVFTGKAGSVIFFDCNTMHGSNGNITPLSRSNAFFVYNSIENTLTDPYAGIAPRPEYIASRNFEPIAPQV